MNTKNESRFFALSYHYIRPAKEIDRFPRILGNRINDFVDQIKTLGQHYHFVSPEEILQFYRNGKELNTKGKIGLLLTFDDGLSEHHNVARILNDLGIKAFFFIPTCIVKDGLPANPNIIHYCLAEYGVGTFLNSFKKAATVLGVQVSIPEYSHGNDPWKTIAEIKRTVKYNLNSTDSRNILLHIYKNLFYRNHPDALEIIHLTKKQIREIIAMDHSIGSHSHSHPSIASTNLSDAEIEKELVSPKLILEKNFGTEVSAFSYPFGELADCLATRDLLSLTKVYDLAFTIEEKINTPSTSPLELGRYMPTSKDDSSSILQKLILMS